MHWIVWIRWLDVAAGSYKVFLIYCCYAHAHQSFLWIQGNICCIQHVLFLFFQRNHLLSLINSKGGNPAPTASWYKNGSVVNGVGHLRNLLFLKNISINDNGNYTYNYTYTYSCEVKSLNLSDATQLVIKVQRK